MGQAGPRSYNVKTGESVYRRNRRQLITAGEPTIIDISDQPDPEPTPTPPQPAELQTQAPGTPVPPAQPTQPSLRRSQRHHKPPARLSDYVPK